MKQFNKNLFIKSLLLLAALFMVIQIVGISRKQYISNSTICPNFGNLSQFKIPKKSIISSPESIKVALLNKDGEKRQIPIRLLDGALFIKNKSEFSEFLNIYSDICGGRPDFYSSIDFIKLEKIQARENLRKSISEETKLGSNQFSRLQIQAKLDKLQKDKNFLETKIASAQKKIDSLTPVHYKIIGRIAEETDKSIIIFGSAIPDVSAKISTPGIVNNGVIILKNFAKKDMVSPKNSEFKHVLANNYKFIKRIDGRDTFGHYMPVHIFERQAIKSNRFEIFSLQANISQYQTKLNKVLTELNSIEIIEEKFIASSF